MKNLRIRIPAAASRSYGVHFCDDGRTIAREIARRYAGVSLFVVSDRNVFPLYGRRLVADLTALGATVHGTVLPPGERSKSSASKKQVDDSLLSGGLRRDSVIVAVGGGVIGDLAGYSAATLLRGVRLVQVPTTLLAQVDSSVGGKVGINHPLGKNLIGAFHQPDAVFISPGMLRTLPAPEYLSGMAEVIKVAMALDGRLFRLLEMEKSAVLARRRAVVSTIISRCIALKAGIVSADERDRGTRRLLNFGHTIGHAIEKLSSFRIPHGRAVAIGMVIEGMVALEMGLLRAPSFERLRSLVLRYGLPASLPPGMPARRLIGAASHDKKYEKGSVRFTLPAGIGRALTGVVVPPDVLRRVLAG